MNLLRIRRWSLTHLAINKYIFILFIGMDWSTNNFELFCNFVWPTELKHLSKMGIYHDSLTQWVKVTFFMVTSILHFYKGLWWKDLQYFFLFYILKWYYIIPHETFSHFILKQIYPLFLLYAWLLTTPMATSKSQCMEANGISFPHNGISSRRHLSHSTSWPANSKAIHSYSQLI